MTPLTEAQAKHIRELLRSAKLRRDSGEFVIEGPHLLEAALEKSPTRIRYAAFTGDANARQLALSARCGKLGITTYSVAAKLASRISDTEEPQGIFAVVSIAKEEIITGDFAIALDAVQDPGNVGTIIRTASWFGIRSIILGESTADPYSPKTVRATQGAIFDVNIEHGTNLLSELKSLREKSWRVVATTLDRVAKPIYNYKFQKKTILVFGSEAHGIRPEILEIADDRIAIPKFGFGESLNVAASTAIVLSELRRHSG